MLKQNKRGWQLVFRELKRLLGGKKAILTVLLVIIPLLLGLAGSFDWLERRYYTFLHPKDPDTRAGIFFLDCLTPETLCKSPGYKSNYWPFGEADPVTFGALFCLAVMSFASIGSERWLVIFGKKTRENTNLPLPHQDPRQNLVLGQVLERKWNWELGKFEITETTSLHAYYLTTRMLPTSVTIVAPPGSGKTASLFFPMVKFLRQAGAAALFFDAKGDDFPPRLFNENFDLGSAGSSIRLSIFNGNTPAQAGERLAEALVPELPGEAAYYSNVAKDALSALVSAYYALNHRYPELSALLEYLTEPDYLLKLNQRIQGAVPFLGFEKQKEAEILLAGLRRVRQLVNQKKDAMGSLVTAITPLTTGNAARLLVANRVTQGYSIGELLRKPGLVRLCLPVADNPRLSPIIGRLVLAEFCFEVLSPTCNKEILKMAMVDEAHNFVTPYIARGIAQARSNRAGMVLAFQSLAQIKDKNLTDAILASSGTRIVMGGVGDWDAERFSRTFGEVELPYLSQGQSILSSEGSSSAGDKSGSSRQKSKGENLKIDLKSRRLFLTGEIRQLKRFHALIESSDSEGRRWGCQLIDMSAGTVEKLVEKFQPGEKDDCKEEPGLFDLVEPESTPPVLTLPLSQKVLGGVEPVEVPEPSNTESKTETQILFGESEEGGVASGE